MSRAARWLTFGSAASILLESRIRSPAGPRARALLLSGEKLGVPPIKLPLALFVLGTLVALAFSATSSRRPPADPQVLRLPRVARRVFLSREICKRIRSLFLAWAGLASITALRGIVQFIQKMQQARALGQNDYSYYVGERITGFMSHWNTFSAQEMFALTMLGALLFFAPIAQAPLGVDSLRWVDGNAQSCSPRRAPSG